MELYFSTMNYYCYKNDFKKSGNIMIHWLRVIYLYEAAFNAVLGIKWRQLTYHSFQSNEIDKGVFGAVPTKLCQDLVLRAELQYKIS